MASAEELEVKVIPPRNGVHYYTLVYLHPFSSGFEGYTRDDYAFDYVRLVLPLAPYRPVTCYGNDVMSAWYDYLTDNGGEKEDDLAEESLAATRCQLFRLLDSERSLLQEEGEELGYDPNSFCRRLIIGGCSQGCGVALDAALHYPLCLAGFIGVVGHCLSSTTLGAYQGMPLHFYRKADDKVMRWDWVKGTLDRLTEAGYWNLHAHGPAPGGHNRSAAQEAGWLREAVWQIHFYYDPPKIDARPLDGLMRQTLFRCDEQEKLNVRQLLYCCRKTQAPLQLRPVELPWTSRLAPRVPLVCAVVEGLLSPEETDALRAFVWQQREGCWDLSMSHLKTAVDDRWGLTDELWSRIKHLVPPTHRDKQLAGLNSHLRFKRFAPGHCFKPHEDSSNTQSLGDDTYNISYLSAVLYLTDPGDAACGGRTRFLAPDCPAYKQDGRCEAAVCEACVDAPVAKGSMVLYAHPLVNADTEVKHGEEKFIMRTDVMYRR